MKSNKQISQFIDILKTANIPGLIMSTPGMGKTSTLEVYCKHHNYQLIQLIASQYSSDDILGIQSVESGNLKRLSPSWYNNLIDNANGRRTLLFIDEITTCDEFIQAPLLNLIFNRSIGDKSLPDDTIIVAAGNYSENLNSAFSMTAPLVNRFMILNLLPKDIDLAEVFRDPITEWKECDYQSKLYDNNTLVLNDEDLNTLSNFIIKNSNLSLCEFKNSVEDGLIGFQSVRSIHYSIKYLKIANQLGFMNSNTAKVVSDTLGPFKSSHSFIKVFNDLVNDRTRMRIKSEIKSDSELVEVLKYFVNHPSEISTTDYKKLRSMVTDDKSEEIKHLFSQLSCKLSSL